MKASLNIIRFLARREGIVLIAYADGPTTKYWSIGCGHGGAKQGDELPNAKAAFDLLKIDAATRAEHMTKLLRRELLQQQFDAILSAYYQGGSRNLQPLLALVNDGKITQAHGIFPLLDTNLKGDHLAGLRKRRVMEQAIFETGDYGELSPIPMWTGDPRKTKPTNYHVQDGDF